MFDDKSHVRFISLDHKKDIFKEGPLLSNCFKEKLSLDTLQEYEGSWNALMV